MKYERTISITRLTVWFIVGAILLFLDLDGFHLFAFDFMFLVSAFAVSVEYAKELEQTIEWYHAARANPPFGDFRMHEGGDK
jgi:hypothetical protein